MLRNFRVIDGEYIVKIWKDVVKHVYNVAPSRFVKVGHEIPLISNNSQSIKIKYSKFTLRVTQFNFNISEENRKYSHMIEYQVI